MKTDRQDSGEVPESLLSRISSEYLRQREEAGVPFDQYPFFLDEEGLERLPQDVKEKALAWLAKNKI